MQSFKSFVNEGILDFMRGWSKEDLEKEMKGMDRTTLKAIARKASPKSARRVLDPKDYATWSIARDMLGMTESKDEVELDDLERVEYKPGSADIISRNAKKRKMEGSEYPTTDGKFHTPASAARQTSGKGKHPKEKFPNPKMVTPEKARLYTSKPSLQMKEGDDSAYAIGMAKAKKMYDDEPPLKKKTIKKAHEIAKSIKNEETELSEILNVAQRKKRGLIMKRNKAKLKRGRAKAEKRIADKERISGRARKQAKGDLVKVLTRGVAKSDLSPQRKAEIERRLSKMSGRIDRSQRKLLPTVRKRDRGIA